MTNPPQPANVTAAEFPGVVRELRPTPAIEAAFRRFVELPHCLFLDSAMSHPTLGRYSFLTADPFRVIEAEEENAASRACEQIQQSLQEYASPSVTGLPPFQGGVAGVFGYELGRVWESLPHPRFDEFRLPQLCCGVYDVVLAFDHAEDRAWLISQGFPEMDASARKERASDRADQFMALLEGRPHSIPARADKRTQPRIDASQLAPQFPAGTLAGLTSDFAADGYLQAVQRAIDYIHAGDIFQVNLSQRLLYPAEDSSVDLYLRLRQRNPATFAAYFAAQGFEVVSASPERFLRVNEREVEARPIKGTTGRHRAPEADLFAGSGLRASEKDRAENVMIVDLLRNDLSRVCEADSVEVTQLCQLESYEFVKHLVSSIRGRLRPGVNAVDLLTAAFPGGSITGAPKVRAMEIIAELEPTARGPYCGSLGYIGFDGAMDTNILIRTITASGGWWQLPVGGGIVAQSSPAKEYEETWHKAAGMLDALPSEG